jgi:uncharacterized protein YbbK (DUF523 family)
MTVLASACCYGLRCRWHGRRAGKSRALRDLEARGVTIIPACPEMLGGLPCPREPVRTIRGRVYATDAQTRSRQGQELTAAFHRGAEACLDLARRHGIADAYLFRLSPSCAPGGITGKLLQAGGITVHPIW